MLVAFIVKVFPAISQTFVLNQITGLLDLGHEVHIYASTDRSSEGAVHPDVEKYGLLDRTTYWWRGAQPKHSRWRRRFRLTRVGLRFLLTRPKPGFRMVLACLSSKSSVPLVFAQATVAAPVYDIVHCHFGPNGQYGVLFKELGKAKRVLVSLHAYELTKGLSPKRLAELRTMSEQADLLLPISRHWRVRLLEWGCKPERVRVHRMGIDTSIFTYHPKRVEDTMRVLTVARLVEKKGVEYAIQAIALVKKRFPGVRMQYSIVGDGPLRGELETLVSRLDLEEIVRFEGSMVQAQVQNKMQISHVFVLPSVTASDGDQEGIPVSLMEAMASGMPVISTWHSGIPELVDHGNSGLLTPERDVESIAEALGKLIESPDLLASMGESAQQSVNSYYNIEVLNRELVALYERLLSNEPL